jgi:tetratricopeptide (TPR) repeat protein
LPIEQARAFGRAAEEYRSTYTMLSSTPDALMNLGNFELAVGNTPRATAYFEQAIVMDPGFVPARLNLVDILRLSRDEIRVEALLLGGISITPNNAALHHSLGLALIRSRQTEAGLEELRKASDLAPTEQRYVYVLGVALNSLGQQDEALIVLENAFQESPTHYDIGWALATILRDSGDFEHAKEVVDALGSSYPDDSNIKALSESLTTVIES